MSQQEEVSFSRWAFAAALGAFLLIGAIDAAYGPLLAAISARFGVSLSSAGTVISVYFAGALAGVLCALPGLRRVSGRAVMTGAMIILAGGCLGIALSRSWWALLAGVFLTGTGFGATDFTLNQLMAATAARHRAARLNVLNAAFGIGAVAGPIIVNALKGATLTLGFAVGSVTACALAAGQRGVLAPVPPRPAPPPMDPDAVRAHRGRLDRVHVKLAQFGLAYFCYVCCEAGTAGWIAAHLSALGYSSHFASGVTSAFWLALAAGRLCAVALRGVPARTIVLSATALLTFSLALALIPRIAPAAYVLAGFAAAPVFPIGLAWAATIMPGDRRPASWALIGSMIGGVLGPAIIAAVVSADGTLAVPAALSAFGLLTFMAMLPTVRHWQAP